MHITVTIFQAKCEWIVTSAKERPEGSESDFRGHSMYGQSSCFRCEYLTALYDNGGGGTCISQSMLANGLIA